MPAKINPGVPLWVTPHPLERLSAMAVVPQTAGNVLRRAGQGDRAEFCRDLPFVDLPDEQHPCRVRDDIGLHCPRISSQLTAHFISRFNAIARFKSFAQK
ncbi:hypothetical protein ACRAVF_33040 [Bradyrhizobium oligotrophicum S58]